jgi:hypothetical protein
MRSGVAMSVAVWTAERMLVYGNATMTYQSTIENSLIALCDNVRQTIFESAVTLVCILEVSVFKNDKKETVTVWSWSGA